MKNSKQFEAGKVYTHEGKSYKCLSRDETSADFALKKGCVVYKKESRHFDIKVNPVTKIEQVKIGHGTYNEIWLKAC